MIYQTTSIKSVISKVFRDLRPEQSNWVVDAYEWIGEAVEYIGCGPQYVRKLDFVEIKDYTGELPPSLIKLKQILYAPPEDINDPPTEDDYDAFKYPMRLSKGSTHISVEKDVAGGFDHHTNQFIKIEGDMIKTTFEEGWVLVSYITIDTDDEGFPLIPDHPSYKEALFWYIVKQMMLGGYVHPTQQINFEVAQQMWMKYCTTARNKLKFPDISKYQEFFENWVNLAPDYYRFERLFQDDGVDHMPDLDPQNYNNLQTRSGHKIFNPTSDD